TAQPPVHRRTQAAVLGSIRTCVRTWSMVRATNKRKRASPKPRKARPRKLAAPKLRRAAGATREQTALAAAELQQLEQRTRELNEARAQQAATSQVLGIISR